AAAAATASVRRGDRGAAAAHGRTDARHSLTPVGIATACARKSGSAGCDRIECRMSLRSFASLLVACLLLLPSSRAPAQPPDTVFLEELTWTELRDQIRSGKTTILLPIGGTEQNGPHMALGKHNVRVKALSAAIARGLGTALVAPVLAYVPEGGLSPPEGHMRFPGTITIPDATFAQILESAARSFKAHGFKDIVFLGDHGGYQMVEKRV